jgi:hypothetical protein
MAIITATATNGTPNDSQDDFKAQCTVTVLPQGGVSDYTTDNLNW